MAPLRPLCAATISAPGRVGVIATRELPRQFFVLLNKGNDVSRGNETRSRPASTSTDASKPIARATSQDLPPHSLLPTPMLLRAALVSTITSMPFLLNLALKSLMFLTKTRISVLQVGKNPVLHSILKQTFYNHFCAGENDREVTNTIQNLKDIGFKGVILTYAREIVVDQCTQEEKSSGMMTAEEQSDAEDPLSADIASWREGVVQTLGFVAENDFLALKLTGAGATVMKSLSSRHSVPQQMAQVLNEVCALAMQRKVRILVDAEQQSVQQGIDAVALDLMRRYNGTGNVVIYNTYQAYLKSTPQILRAHMESANREGFTLGVKLVRGAYIVSEPRHLINDTKADTDESYNSIARGLIEKSYKPFAKDVLEFNEFPSVSLFLATHNKESAIRAHRLHQERVLGRKETIAVQYGQLLGMADEVSCSLLQMGKGQESVKTVSPEVYKCLTWGVLEDCLSYLLRRAVENRDAVARSKIEYRMVWAELWRRATAPLRL